IVQFSCRGERPFARKRSWLESHAYYAKNGTIGAFGSESANAGQSPSVASRTSCGQLQLRRAEELILGSVF
ncbi:hypothetical protein, partial [Mesotoga sp.]|uniref:hypothetical protein n=1 Tax=Mesotoga sp. TaxID=2053577 RepID=UPI00356335BB